MNCRIGYDLGLCWQAEKEDACSKVGMKVDRKENSSQSNASEVSSLVAIACSDGLSSKTRRGVHCFWADLEFR